MNNLDKDISYSFFCQVIHNNRALATVVYISLPKKVENSLDRVKIKKPEILVYKEVHEFPVFAIFALDELVIRAQ